MKLSTLSGLAMIGLVATLAIGQNAPAPKPAPAKAAPATRTAAAKTSPVDDVIGMFKAGFSEALIIKKLQKDNKPVDLTPADMVKLKNAGVSETIMGAMMDPTSAPAAAAPAAVPPPAPEAASAPPPPPPPPANLPGGASVTPASMPAAPTNAQKKRVIVDEFDYSAVKTMVQSVFGTQQDIGKGRSEEHTSELQSLRHLV